MLSEDNVRSENVVLRKKSQLMACPFRFNALYTVRAQYRFPQQSSPNINSEKSAGKSASSRFKRC